MKARWLNEVYILRLFYFLFPHPLDLQSCQRYTSITNKLISPLIVKLSNDMLRLPVLIRHRFDDKANCKKIV